METLLWIVSNGYRVGYRFKNFHTEEYFTIRKKKNLKQFTRICANSYRIYIAKAAYTNKISTFIESECNLLPVFFSSLSSSFHVIDNANKVLFSLNLMKAFLFSMLVFDGFFYLCIYSGVFITKAFCLLFFFGRLLMIDGRTFFFTLILHENSSI